MERIDDFAHKVRPDIWSKSASVCFATMLLTMCSKFAFWKKLMMKTQDWSELWLESDKRKPSSVSNSISLYQCRPKYSPCSEKNLREVALSHNRQTTSLPSLSNFMGSALILPPLRVYIPNTTWWICVSSSARRQVANSSVKHKANINRRWIEQKALGEKSNSKTSDRKSTTSREIYLNKAFGKPFQNIAEKPRPADMLYWSRNEKCLDMLDKIISR